MFRKFCPRPASFLFLKSHTNPGSRPHSRAGSYRSDREVCYHGYQRRHSQDGGGRWSKGKIRRWMYLAVGEPSKPESSISTKAATLNQ